MKQTAKKLKELVSNNNIEDALLKLQNIFSLTDSELVNDVVLLSARRKKLNSDIRKGVISYNEQNLERNQITNGILSLIDEVSNNPELILRYNEVEERIQKDQLEKTNIPMPDKVKDVLVQRLTTVKNKQLKIKGLWIDDTFPNPNYLKLFSSTGVEFETANNSDLGLEMIKRNNYELIISDIARKGNPNEGLDFHKKLIKSGYRIPTIFFIGNFNPEFGTPPYAFGVTNLLSELIHYVLDIIERNY